VLLESIDCGATLMDDLERSPGTLVDDLVSRLEALARDAGHESAINLAAAPASQRSTNQDPPCRYHIAMDFTACQDLGVGPLEVVERVLRLGRVEKGRVTCTDMDDSAMRIGGAVTWEAEILSTLDPAEFTARLLLPVSIVPPPNVLAPGKETAPTDACEPAAIAPAVDARKSERRQAIRIPVGLADRLVNLAGELVLVRNQTRRFVEGQQPLPPSVVQRFDHVTGEIQETVLRTRMQPVGQLFQKFPRLVRDLGRQLGKQIQLEILGAETEVDTSILDALSDPLTHLVRNACDHGIEPTDERLARQKPEEARIWLSARHTGDQICLEIRDDGRGIDRAAVARKAQERGLRNSDELARSDDRALLSLIFLPGFSTATSVTDVSGRGVGLDVVHTNVTQLGGIIEIQSEWGRGTKFTLRLPLTLAIIPSLLIEISGQRFALPQRDLHELV
ncbi:MAG TPA: ATP-binding protein, partial [Pirellulaceae bacterium]